MNVVFFFSHENLRYLLEVNRRYLAPQDYYKMGSIQQICDYEESQLEIF